jgi:hypothetical protein
MRGEIMNDIFKNVINKIANESDINDLYIALTSFGIQIKNSDGSFRPLYDIFNSLSEWYALNNLENKIKNEIGGDKMNNVNNKIVRCIENNHFYDKLTMGKEYIVTAEDDTKYFLVSDNGFKLAFLKKRFEEVTTEKYSPIEYTIDIKTRNGITEVEINNFKVDKDLFGIGNIYEFLNLPFDRFGFVDLQSKSKIESVLFDYFNKISYYNIGRFFEFNRNQDAIEFAYIFSKNIKKINDKLTTTVKQVQTVYLVEHQPNGKLYAFKSTDKLEVGQLVICDTIKGQQYGIVKKTGTDSIFQYNKRSSCRKA